MFNNITGSGVRILEEVLCDPANIGWIEFEASVGPNIRIIDNLDSLGSDT